MSDHQRDGRHDSGNEQPGSDPSDTDHPTGSEQAEENAAEESPS